MYIKNTLVKSASHFNIAYFYTVYILRYSMHLATPISMQVEQQLTTCLSVVLHNLITDRSIVFIKLRHQTLVKIYVVRTPAQHQT